MSSSFPKLKVYSALALGLTAFGFAPILVKFSTDHSAFLVAAIRTVSAWLMLIPFYLAYQNKDKGTKSLFQKKADRTEHLWVALAGCGLGVHFILWISSLYYTSVASASVLVTIHPVILIVTERIFFKVNFKIRVWLGVLIASLGSVLLGYSDINLEATDFVNPVLGNTMAFTAAVVFAVYFLIGRKVRQNRNWIEYVFPVYGYAALTCVVALLLFDGIPHISDFQTEVILVGLALAIGPQIMGHGSLNYAVKYLSPTLLSTLILAEPLFSTILAYFFFAEWPVTLSLFAMFIILGGVMLTWSRNKEPGSAVEET